LLYDTLDTSGSDLVVALENMPDRRTSTQNVVVSMKDFVDLLGRSPVMKFTLDIGHALQNDDAAYPGFVARYTPSIAHIHLHEGVAPGAGHLKLGSGQLDLAAFLSLTRDVSHSRSLSLEMLSWPDTAASWQVLMEEWRRLRRKSP
jgi:sugar phosphate isomerase/epimerase